MVVPAFVKLSDTWHSHVRPPKFMYRMVFPAFTGCLVRSSISQCVDRQIVGINKTDDVTYLLSDQALFIDH
ncbi:uncharacterized protein PHALS_12716 [Plasmopara halstedii]|uniref:Uncharacterized protein n=1 Tax=Plasmopara halstedii TaxID=4781 RepID=A0A0P1AMX6_PLAHL|nr:uncharacterized protein PHALS_12716 [Plasmopara halstedii]CEG42439.1 hypothetical protein PHALS_12716 [Plasmopara halstedii]|eukprot:XP_024578808.1 hypothetical protein PHALS_12716 [Plasmopara halstedii]